MIVDPTNFSKESNLAECQSELEAYAAALGIDMPTITIGPYEDAYNSWSARGMYIVRERRINIDPKKCRSATKVPGFAWSYTGFKSDMTPAGVLAHEFGHYIDDVKDVSRPNRRRLGELHDEEGCVSSYCPNPSEWFAETFRLFFLNPHLLWCGKPRTFDFMALELRLPISRRETWQEIMVNAHPKFAAACVRFAVLSTRADPASWARMVADPERS